MPKVSQRKRVKRDQFDVIASGSSGQWTVLVEETHTGPAKWFAQIEGPSVCFSFELPSITIIEALLDLLERQSVSRVRMRPKQVNGSLGITFIRDDEYTDRCFVAVGPDKRPTVRYAIAGTDVLKLADAFRQVVDELKSEGLIS